MASTCKGLSPSTARLSIRFHFIHHCHWPGPRSLATTCGVSVDVLSSGYLDVSVRRVCLATYGFSGRYRLSGGLPHSEIHGSQPARGSPWLIATCCVLHRLSVPRHPPDALQTLDLIGVYPSADQRSDDRVNRLSYSPNATRRGKPAHRRSSRRCITTQPLNRRHAKDPGQ